MVHAICRSTPLVIYHNVIVNVCIHYIYFAVKFNCTVPGTIHNISECTQTTMTVDNSDLETTALQSSSSMPTTPTEEIQIISVSNTNNRPVFETGSPLFSGVVATGSAIIIILLLCMIGVSLLACRRGCKCVL